MRASRGGAAVACTLVAWARLASAAPTESELATARQLFTEGVALEDARDWGAALERFRRVAAIKRTPQVRYNVGLCLSNIGHLVEAENELSPVAEASGDADTVAVASLARKKLAELHQRIPRVVVNLPPGAAGDATATLDGVAINPALIGTPILVDPGPHAIVVTEASNPAAHAETKVVAVEGAAEPVVAALAFSALPAPTPSTPGTHKKVPVWAFVTGGVAVASLGTALGLGLARISAITTLNGECGSGGQYCPQSAHGKVDLVDAETIGADVLAGVGVAAIIGTGVIIHFAPTVPAAQGAATGVSVAGEF
jgi:hypothetical protein